MSKTRPGLHRAVHSRLDHYLASLRAYVKSRPLHDSRKQRGKARRVQGALRSPNDSKWK
jgi:hypothetical protein